MEEWLEAVRNLSAAGAPVSEADTDARIDTDGDVDANPEAEDDEDDDDERGIALAAIQRCEQALEALRSVLSPKHADELGPILSATGSNPRQQPPYFDLSIIQRYVLQRVFDLGWTTGATRRSGALR
jgi:hypothetical protein